jgi:hypothetical protein
VDQSRSRGGLYFDGIVGPVELGVVASPDIDLFMLLLFDMEPAFGLLMEPLPPIEVLPEFEPFALDPVPLADPLLVAEPPFSSPPPPPPDALLPPLPPPPPPLPLPLPPVPCAKATVEPSAKHTAKIEVESLPTDFSRSVDEQSMGGLAGSGVVRIFRLSASAVRLPDKTGEMVYS